MRQAIFSDIHGNLEAFQAVVADCERQELDGFVCLGDMIGYGPDPEEVVQGVRNLGARTVLGNHEAALVTEGARKWMNFEARENSILTERLLSADSLAFCRNLPRFLRDDESWFVHGFPPHSAYTYLFDASDRAIEKLFAAREARLFFVGHTHDLQLVSEHQGTIVRSPLAQGRIRLEEDRNYIVNVGSVGQPRDGDRCAKYLIWDNESQVLEVLFIPYDREKTIRKIHERGFAGIFAERLR